MTTAQARAEAMRKPAFRICVGLGLLLLVIGLVLHLAAPEIRPGKGPWALPQPEGIGYGPFALAPGSYRLEVNPGQQSPGVSTIWVMLEQSKEGLRFDRSLEQGQRCVISVPLDQEGSYVVKLRMPGRSWDPRSITLKLSREARWTWVWMLAGGLMLALAGRLVTVHTRLLRGESF